MNERQIYTLTRDWRAVSGHVRLVRFGRTVDAVYCWATRGGPSVIGCESWVSSTFPTRRAARRFMRRHKAS